MQVYNLKNIFQNCSQIKKTNKTNNINPAYRGQSRDPDSWVRFPRESYFIVSQKFWCEFKKYIYIFYFNLSN